MSHKTRKPHPTFEQQCEAALAMGSMKAQHEARELVVARHRAERKAAEKARKEAAKEKNK